MRNDEGFTAVHLTAYKGNLTILHFLIKNNASIFVKNVTGLTPMHTAAQGDNP
jgi:ankyrin repeat protein